MNQRRIDMVPLFENQTPLFHDGIDLIEDPIKEHRIHKGVTEFTDGRLIGNVVNTSDSQKLTKRDTIANKFFCHRIAQVVPCLQEKRPQHHRNRVGRPSAFTRSLWMYRYPLRPKAFQGARRECSFSSLPKTYGSFVRPDRSSCSRRNSGFISEIIYIM